MGRCSGRPYTDHPVCLVCRRAALWVVVSGRPYTTIHTVCLLRRRARHTCGSLFWSTRYNDHPVCFYVVQAHCSEVVVLDVLVQRSSCSALVCRTRRTVWVVVLVVLIQRSSLVPCVSYKAHCVGRCIWSSLYRSTKRALCVVEAPVWVVVSGRPYTTILKACFVCRRGACDVRCIWSSLYNDPHKACFVCRTRRTVMVGIWSSLYNDPHCVLYGVS